MDFRNIVHYRQLLQNKSLNRKKVLPTFAESTFFVMYG